MKIRKIKLLSQLVEQGAIRPVAEAHSMSVDELVATISSLEAELNIVLFEQSNEQIRLTAAGEEYLKRCEEIMSEADDWMDTLQPTIS